MISRRSLILATAGSVVLSVPSRAQKMMPVAKVSALASQTGHVRSRDINYYYEIHGDGEPLLLLHGGLVDSDSFRPILPILQAGRQVIAVDLQGHGRTNLGNHPIVLPDIADDLAHVVKELGYDAVDVLGYSLGGGAGLRLAIQHPEAVRNLVLVSTCFAPDAFYPGLRAQQAQIGAAQMPMMVETPIYKSYAAIAPNPDDFPKLLDAVGDWMRRNYDWSEDVETLKMRVMLIYGDSDAIRPEHMVKFYHLLGGGLADAGWQREHMSRNRLAILPDVTHYEIFAQPSMAQSAVRFLSSTS